MPLMAASIPYFREHYLNSDAELADWRASPARAENFAGLPPALLITAECDILNHEGRECSARLNAEGVACAPVLTRSELIEHPQVVANQVVMESDHPVAGPVRQARHAAQFGGTPASIRIPAPGLGENTDEILAELGLDEAEIADLRATGIAGEDE